jgi:hypothetical protein
MKDQNIVTPPGVKAFDLEGAKRGEPIVRRDGVPAKFVGHCPEHPHTSVRLITLSEGLYRYNCENGSYFSADQDSLDLFMA